jgi:hypothetical protein
MECASFTMLHARALACRRNVFDDGSRGVESVISSRTPPIGEPRRPAGRRDERVEPVLPNDAFRARGLSGDFSRTAAWAKPITAANDWPCGSGGFRKSAILTPSVRSAPAPNPFPLIFAGLHPACILPVPREVRKLKVCAMPPLEVEEWEEGS